MYRYAIINIKTGIVKGISNLTGEVNKPDMILISSDFDITNKKYINGEWIEYTPEPLPESGPTDLDIIKEAVLKSNEELRQEGYDNCVMDFIKEGVI